MYRFEIFRDSAGQYRFRFVAEYLADYLQVLHPDTLSGAAV